MIIQANEYTLRSFTPEDVIPFYNLAHDECVKRYVAYAYPVDYEAAEELVSMYSNADCIRDFYLLIEKDNQIVGAIIAIKIKMQTLDVCSMVSKEFRNEGVMTVAMRVFINWLRKNTNYKVLSMLIDKDNKRSNRQIQKIGGIYQYSDEHNNFYNVFL